MTSRSSSKRPTRWSNGRPNASYSGPCQPEPTPSTRRPPDRSSSVPAILAIRPAFRNDEHMTRAPSSTRGTTGASAASVVHASLRPSSASGGKRNSRWSKTQIESRPSRSAVRAKASVSSNVGARPSTRSPYASGTVTPIRIGRSLSAPLSGQMEPAGRVASPTMVSEATEAAPPPRGGMQRELVERAKRGDHDAFAVLAGAAISRMDSAAWLILGDPEQAKDAVQNTLVRAWRDLPTLRDPDRFDAWLQRLLVRACIDEARRLRRHRIDVELTSLDFHAVAGHESAVADRDELERGFQRLQPELRAVLVLHHYLDLSLPDVAAILGVPMGTAKSRLHRARESMRAALDAEARAGSKLVEGRPA